MRDTEGQGRLGSVLDTSLCMKPMTSRAKTFFFFVGAFFWRRMRQTVIEKGPSRERILYLLASRHSMEVNLADVEELAIKLQFSLGC